MNNISNIQITQRDTDSKFDRYDFTTANREETILIKDFLKEIDSDEIENSWNALQESLYNIGDSDLVGLKINEDTKIAVYKNRLETLISESFQDDINDLEVDIILTETSQELDDLEGQLQGKELLDDWRKTVLDEKGNASLEKINKLDINTMWKAYNEVELTQTQRTELYSMIGDKLIKSGPDNIQTIIDEGGIPKERLREMVGISIFNKERIVKDTWASLDISDKTARDEREKIAMEAIISSSKISNEYGITNGQLNEMFDNVLYDNRKSAREGLAQNFSSSEYVSSLNGVITSMSQDGRGATVDKFIDSRDLHLDEDQRGLIKSAGKFAPVLLAGWFVLKGGDLLGNDRLGKVKRAGALATGLIGIDLLASHFINEDQHQEANSPVELKNVEAHISRGFFETFKDNNFQKTIGKFLSKEDYDLKFDVDGFKEELKRRKTEEDCDEAAQALAEMNKPGFDKDNFEKQILEGLEQIDVNYSNYEEITDKTVNELFEEKLN